jgi:hypothetical protein
VLSEIIMIAIIFAAPRRCHRQGDCLWRPTAFFPLNKAALSKIGVSCKKSGRNFFEHLLDENIKTYASIDVPHLLKCTRNQFLLSSRTGNTLINLCQMYFLIKLFSLKYASRTFQFSTRSFSDFMIIQRNMVWGWLRSSL